MSFTETMLFPIFLIGAIILSFSCWVASPSHDSSYRIKDLWTITDFEHRWQDHSSMAADRLRQPEQPGEEHDIQMIELKVIQV